LLWLLHGLIYHPDVVKALPREDSKMHVQSRVSQDQSSECMRTHIALGHPYSLGSRGFTGPALFCIPDHGTDLSLPVEAPI